MRLGGVLFALLLPVSSAALSADDQPICADRPGKANPTCTVPPGTMQVESGLVDWTGDRSRGIRTDEFDLGATAVKFGLSDRLHIEFDLPAYVSLRARAAGVTSRISGLGDSGVALKLRITRDSAPVQIALYPRVKIPTASHSLGNRRVEGGLAVLADGTFGKSGVGWDVAPEVDVAADADGHGYHLATVQVASVGIPLSGRFGISGDLWGSWDFDPTGTIRQYSADAAAAYLLTENVQIDAGANFGLNPNTPDLELYSGVAVRF